MLEGKGVKGDSPFFGVNLSIDSPVGCTISVDDEVEIIRMTNHVIGDMNAQTALLAAVTLTTVISMAVLIFKKYN